MKILLVEDNEAVAKGLIYLLNQNEFDVIHKMNVLDTTEFLIKEIVDLIILDISLPDGDGFNLYKDVIRNKEIPTIFLTAKDGEDDIVNGLELGAEDYIVKPFKTRELIVRMNRILKKGKKDFIVKVKDIELVLTSLELKILHLLFININKVVARNDIIDKIWEWTGNDVNDNTVTVYLKRIREKLGTDIIVTVKGIGYRIDKI